MVDDIRAADEVSTRPRNVGVIRGDEIKVAEEDYLLLGHSQGAK